MSQVEIAPGHWLGGAAAASWRRMRAAGMPGGGITEAGRTRARQEYLYAQYLAGRLVAYAARPGTSKHEGGRAVDMVTSSAAHAWLITHGRAHGWTRPLLRAAKPEPWHWEHSITIDQHLTDDTTPVTPIEEDDMTPDQARMLEEVHAALGAGGAKGMPSEETILGLIRTLPGRIAAAVWDQPVDSDDPRGGAQTHPARAWLTAAAYRLRQLVGE